MGALTVTGAGGYLGRAVVAEALARGHSVRAVVRRDVDLPGATVVVADLAGGTDLRPVFDGSDAIIHCAARMTGAESDMHRDTVGGTAALVSAVARRTRLVLVSSLAVYQAGAPWSCVTESTPLEPRPELRDAYTRTKLLQEQAARGAKLPLWIVRPGILWGQGQVWNAHLGVSLGPLFLRIGGAGELPLAHVAHVARALVIAAETEPPQRVSVVNIVDDERPTRAAFLRAIPEGPHFTLPLSWHIPDAFAGLLGPRAPGLLRRPTLRARMMPLTYSNAAAKALLGWEPHLTFEQGLRA